MELNSSSPQATVNMAPQIMQWLQNADVRLVLLRGDLGAGKTLLVRAIVEHLGGDPGEVTSPTFALHNSYSAGDLEVQHYDLYRLDHPGVMLDELAEAVHEPGNICFVEWPAAEIESLAGVKTAVIAISRTAVDDQRVISLSLIKPTVQT